MSLLKLAEAQLTGYSHAARGYSIKDLARSMNLTKREWIKLRELSDLKQSDKDDLDSMFGIQSK